MGAGLCSPVVVVIIPGPTVNPSPPTVAITTPPRPRPTSPCVVLMSLRVVVRTRRHRIVVRRCASCLRVVAVGARCASYVVVAVVCGVRRWRSLCAGRCCCVVVCSRRRRWPVVVVVVVVNTELTRRSFLGRRSHTTATYPRHGYGFARVSIWLPVPVPVAKPAENPRVYPYP
jgi:hypothetical protein